MKPNNLIKIIILYIYMYFVGPLIWGVWMIYKLKIITLKEYLHCLLSFPILIMLAMYFLVNTFFIIKLMHNAFKNETLQIESMTVLTLHSICVISFGSIGTFAFLSMLSTNNFCFYTIIIGNWIEKAIIGALSGSALVFMFYIFFSTTIITTITNQLNEKYDEKSKKTLDRLRHTNMVLYIIGLILFLTTSIVAIMYTGILNDKKVITVENIRSFALLAFPIFMSWLLFKKSVKVITSKMMPVNATKSKHQNSISTIYIKIKSITQIAALLFFIVLFLTQKIRFWVIILIIGFILSLFFGRVYCGWICPVNTINCLMDSMLKRMQINKAVTPKWLQHGLSGIFVFVLFLCAFISSLILRVRPQLFMIISLLGILVSAVFGSFIWCNHLCPWGTILRNLSKFSFCKLFIKTELCVQCGKCSYNCPSKSIKISSDHQTIDTSSCLQCLECVDACTKNAIGVTSSKN